MEVTDTRQWNYFTRWFIAGHYGHFLEFGVLLTSGKIFFEYRRYYVYNIRDVGIVCR